MSPSLEHQGLVTLVLDCPALLLWLLRNVLGVPLSEQVTIRPGPESIHELKHPDHHADGVMVVDGNEAYVIEVQLQIDESKRWVWALYASGTGLRLGANTSVVVLTPSKRVEAWCSESFRLGHGGIVLTPLVLGPSNVPSQIDPALARALPELAVLVVAIHPPGSKRSIVNAVQAIQTLDATEPQRAVRLRRLLCVFAPQLETTMTQMERDLFWKRVDEHYMRVAPNGVLRYALEEAWIKAHERARIERERALIEHERARIEHERALIEQRVAAVLAVLEARSLTPSPQQRARIEAEQDDVTLGRWIRRAALAHAVEDLF